MKKLFTNDKFFLAMVIFGFVGSVLCSIYYAIPTINAFNPPAATSFAFEAICAICLYVSYKKHSKNVMKGMLAAVLTSLLMDFTCWMVDLYFSLDLVFNCIAFGLIAILFVNHFIINSEHHSKPVNIRINQIVALLYFVDCLVWDITWALSFPLGVETVGACIECISCTGLIATIVCVESRLDAYRIDREKAGWTEEKGYPEGYVHEYEKRNG